MIPPSFFVRKHVLINFYQSILRKKMSKQNCFRPLRIMKYGCGWIFAPARLCNTCRLHLPMTKRSYWNQKIPGKEFSRRAN